ncbi:hypothetical protein M407DRAFT_26589 [Tulasnella calospora MUT 4182]|uniref:Protein kinase domain-containing protein n=1 Tax=Tulasnella calospora MUT 4182 TaxID=1051891 RepID=A0A0C3Q4P5_9AGAM|nr:hypothetical protein M407DRAFT_26589 [Tulasnella calospora MUT 4182]
MNEGDEKEDQLSERGDDLSRGTIEALGSKYRIKLSAIKPLGNGQLYGRGGKGDIILATLVPPEDGSFIGATTSENVAVKNIRPLKSKYQERFLQVRYVLVIGDSQRMIGNISFKAFANELSILSTVSHMNIIKLIGFVEDAENWIAWFVFPWEAHGNIREFILSTN